MSEFHEPTANFSISIKERHFFPLSLSLHLSTAPQCRIRLQWVVRLRRPVWRSLGSNVGEILESTTIINLSGCGYGLEISDAKGIHAQGCALGLFEYYLLQFQCQILLETPDKTRAKEPKNKDEKRKSSKIN